jgi:hypothetical protein
MIHPGPLRPEHRRDAPDNANIVNAAFPAAAAH